MSAALVGSAQPQVTDALGCSLEKLDESRQIHSGGVIFHKKGSNAGAPGQVIMPASARGYLIGLSTSAGHRRRIFDGRRSRVHEFDENSVYLRRFADDYKADLEGSFQFILMEFPQAVLDQVADAADIARVTELRCVDHAPDPVLGGLLRSLFATADGHADRCALFVDQLSTAIGIHLLHRYGDGHAATASGRLRLSSRREAIAKELIRSRLNGDVSVADLAAACGLSKAAFLAEFRESTGKTPHQWLMQYRLERARGLLLFSQMSLQEISDDCGFSDQSHFSRAFSAATGAPPAIWRKINVK